VFGLETEHPARHIIVRDSIDHRFRLGTCGLRVDASASKSQTNRGCVVSIRDKIVRCLTGFGDVRFSQADVDALVGRVEDADVERPCAYAHVVARNWAVDRRRAVGIMERKAEAERELAQSKAREAELKREFEQARQEFWPVAHEALAQVSSKNKRAHEKVRALFLRVFEGLTDEGFALVFPGVSADARYQWTRRGKKLLRPYASEVLWRVIDRHGHAP
jgi:hypothetical protein